MNEENTVNYYAIIPATVRYDKELKFAERLLYGEITALSNTSGYCYAKNKYFAELYAVSNETISRWLSHLKKLGYIEIKVIRNERKQVIARNIYIMDTPYCQKNQYPSIPKNQEGIDEKVKDNIINSIDDLFYYLYNNSDRIPKEFYTIIERLEFNYSKNLLDNMQEENINKLKNIYYTIYSIYNSEYKRIIPKFERETLISLYISCKEHNVRDFLYYYKQSVINKYTER